MTHEDKWVLILTLCIGLVMLLGAIYLGSNVRWYGAREDLYRGFFETMRRMFEY